MIYAEYNGSCPLLPSVREHLKKRFDSELFGNPNAIHSIGQKLSKGMQKCRETIAGTFGCFPDQIFFNSGSSEGISQIFHSILERSDNLKNIIITSPIEHSIIPNALSYYQERKGFLIKYVEIDNQGRVLLESLERLLHSHQGKIALVTIMAVNNETGVYQPYQEIAQLCRKHDVKYFCDTTQLIGKGHFHFEESGLDYAVCSGHKLGALPGSGFMIVREPSQLLPLVFGSTQEKGLRGGTQNYLGIETLAVAAKDFQENTDKLLQLEESKLVFETEIKKAFPEVVIIGDKAKRLAGTTLIGYPGIHGQAIQIELESNDIFVTTSAACLDNQPETSKVLKAMGINDQLGRGVVRISLSYCQGETQYYTISRILNETYAKLSKIKSF
jgi:cysteine desulfurase